MKVYLQAALIALLGLGIAFADRKLRPVSSVEKAGEVAPKPPEVKPEIKPEGKPSVTPEVKPEAKPEGKPVVTPEPKPTPTQTTSPAPAGPVTVIPNLDPATLPVKLELAQAYTLFAGGATMIDGRKPEEFAAGRVQGAINLRNLDVQTNAAAWNDFFQVADMTAVHVVYCSGKDCPEADQLRDTLAAVGFKKVFVMTSSVEEWKAAGLPTE
jgi:rhodanese-related sulfurtransferase